MSKHTPAPWVIHEYEIECAANRCLVATVAAPSPRLRGKEWHEEHDICAANARLIAAAPELLEALQYWLPKELPFPNQPNDVVCQAHNNRWREARAAIANATGEQQ